MGVFVLWETSGITRYHDSERTDKKSMREFDMIKRFRLFYLALLCYKIWYALESVNFFQKVSFSVEAVMSKIFKKFVIEAFKKPL